jgi:hypothetical protein
VRIDRAEVLRRVDANAGSGERPGIRPAVLQEHLDRFEWPGPDEDALELDALCPVDRHVEAIARRLAGARLS